jgi:hypothetical protein
MAEASEVEERNVQMEREGEEEDEYGMQGKDAAKAEERGLGHASRTRRGQ